MRSAELDDEVVAFLAERGRRTAAEFGKKPADPPLLEWGERPEFRAVTAGGRSMIFVQREGAHWWRIRYQIAHEVFHWLCTSPHTFHWTHEFFAVETAVRAMAAIGELGYARREMERLSEEAESIPLDAMLVTPLTVSHPTGLSGRAWVTGRQLTGAVGWVRTKLLAVCSTRAGSPTSWGGYARFRTSSRPGSRPSSAPRRRRGPSSER